MSDDSVWRDVLKGLERGDFSRLEPLFNEDSTTEGERCRIIEWYENGYFDNEPKALVSSFGRSAPAELQVAATYP